MCGVRYIEMIEGYVKFGHIKERGLTNTIGKSTMKSNIPSKSLGNL